MQMLLTEENRHLFFYLYKLYIVTEHIHIMNLVTRTNINLKIPKENIKGKKGEKKKKKSQKKNKPTPASTPVDTSIHPHPHILPTHTYTIAKVDWQ